MADRLHPDVIAAHRDVARLLEQRGELLRESAAAGTVDVSRLAELDGRIGGLLDAVLPLTDPCDASPTEPLVLLPVRLETRFGARGRRTTLRVRIYPDEIHVDDVARGLTDEEVQAGRAYWARAWVDPVPEGAWPELLAAVGPERAEWVAHACTPLNLAERTSAAPPSFPEPPARGARNVVARALPDRFVVLAIQGDEVSQAVGRPVAADVRLSPLPLEGDEVTRDRDALSVPPGSEWLVDYERAVEVGMAVTVTLAGGNAPVDRVIALGTRASLSPQAGAAELEDVLAGHRYGRGLGLLAQGTPTNNADAERSPYRARREPQPPALTPAAAPPGSDVAALAELLGVDAATLAGLVGEGTGEQALARRVNTALWAPGWGEFLSRLDAQEVPGVTDGQRESARGLFRDHVRGRGPAPALRVGAQPYGVLPVSDLGAWVSQAGETTAGIVGVVRSLLTRWRVAAAVNVPRIRPGQPDVDAAMLEVLGSSPVMQGLRVRPVLTDDVSDAVIAGLGAGRSAYQAENVAAAAVASQLLGSAAPKIVVGSLHAATRPLPLPLASERDPAFVEALLAGTRTPAADSVLQALLALAWDSSELDVAKAAPATVLPTLLEFIELEPALKARATAIVARADRASAEELHGVVADLLDAGVELGGPSVLRRFQPVEQVSVSLAEVALSAPPTAQAQTLAASALAGWVFAMGYRSEVRAAMQALAGSDVAARALAVAEALDCSSHRLDAWATAIVAQRRARQAARGGRGLTIGAYGVVENLRPQAGPSQDGWIYAPSTRHATAAGMLRSSQLSHLSASAGDGDGGPFAIDLSSRRVQAAAHVIEGVRQGQQLGPLVGYEIERGLAAARLARLQLSLRAIAPSVELRLHGAQAQDTEAARESLAARNVVDGVLLLHRHAPGDSALRARLDAPPKNAYLEPGDWEPLTDAEWDAVTRVMRKAADTIDAVADIMLSESVLQFAGGNPQRAAAAMDAMATGASPSDTIDVLEAQDSGERLTHRVLAVVGGGRPASAWNAERPRARVEPRLEAWVAAHLGDPANVVVADTGAGRITLEQADLAALDLVFGGDLVRLERSLRAALPGLDGAALAIARDPGWPAPLRALGQVAGLASTLRATIAGARPLLPAELARPGVSPERDLEAALPELVARAAALAASLAAAVAALAPAVAAIPADGIVEDDSAASALGRAIGTLDAFGVALEPDASRPLDVSWVRAAWEAAEARALACQAAVAEVSGLPADTPASLVLDGVQEAVGTVFGDGFLVVPLLSPSGAGEAFAEALAAPAFPAPAQSALRRWVRDVATVRPQVTRLSEALLLGGALRGPRSLRAAQLSERGEDGPAPGTTHWLAGPLPADGPWPQSPVAHLVVDEVGSIGAADAVGGLTVDAWVEDLPAQVGPKADPDDPRPGRARTALAIRANAASARPPQSLLCAVSPNGARWTTAALRGVVEQTLELSRARMVTLERMIGDGLVLPALYTRSSSLQGERPALHFGKLATVATEVPIKFVKESGP